MEINENDIALLRRIENYLSPSNMTDLVYRTEAETLRMAADRAEAKQHDLHDFRALILRALGHDISDFS